MLFQKEHAIAIIFIIITISAGILLKNFIIKKEDVKINIAENSDSTDKKKYLNVEIKGAVKKPGKYKIKKGSRLADLVSLAGGFSPLAKNKKIKKNYYLKEAYTFYIPFKRYNKETNVVKSPKRKFIKRIKKKKIEVEIRGAVSKPGIYEVPYGTKLNGLIHKAGGYLKNARPKLRNYSLRDGQSFYISFKSKLIK